MDVLAILQFVISTAAPIVVFWFLNQRIKLQQYSIDSLKINTDAVKANIESMEKYFNVMKGYADSFKIDELKKNFEIQKENAVYDAVSNIDEAIIKQTQDYLTNDIKTQKMLTEIYEKQEVMQKYAELLAMTCVLLRKHPPEKINKLFDTKYPRNAQALKESMKLYQ